MEPALLIVGASARAAAFSAARAGLVPWSWDRFGDSDLRARHRVELVADYTAELLQLLAAQPGVPLMYVGALENYPRLVDRLAENRPLYGNTGPVLRDVRDPFRLARVLGEQDLLFPEVRRDAAGLPRDGSWLYKPLRSCGGWRISPLDETFAESVEEQGTYFQRRVTGESCAAIYVAARGIATLLGVTRQLIGESWTGASGFQYCGSIGPLALPESLLAQYRKLGNVLSSEFGLTGLFGVDVVVEEQRVCCIEVNPRYTASVEVLEQGLGIRAIEHHVQAFQQQVLPAEPREPAGQQVGKVILYAREEIKGKQALWRTLLEENRDLQWPLVTDIPMPESVILAQAPMLTLWATGVSGEEVESALRKRVVEFGERLGRTEE
jgi:predicted ATP-grasp superfamily ATP-dependent carboligase